MASRALRRRLVLLLCLLALLLVLTSTTGASSSSAGSTRAALSILDFGGKAAPGHNNQAAIGKAMAACDAAGGCTLTFPRVGTASPPACPREDITVQSPAVRGVNSPRAQATA